MLLLCKMLEFQHFKLKILFYFKQKIVELFNYISDNIFVCINVELCLFLFTT